MSGKRKTGMRKYRKTIRKRLYPKADYSRELLVMAILAKRPSSLVKFLGWFEERKTLYIAMEYLEKGDLTKHIGTPLTQEPVRNISKQILEGLDKIFVCVKLADFGVSKQILAQAITFHTQVATPVYSAPEVLGLDYNSENSEYTNSVDIWSLGCVIYELFVETKLFISEGQVSHYYFCKWPFPEDTLKKLSPPIDDLGISLLKSMLIIQPEDRPTLADALNHGWLAFLQSDKKDNGDNENERRESSDESALSGKRKNRLAIFNRPKIKRTERNSITQDRITRIRRCAVSVVNTGSQIGADSTIPESMPGTPMVALLDATSIENPVVQMGLQTPELIPHNFQATHSKSPKVASRSPNTKLPLLTNRVANKNQMLNPRPSANDPSRPNSYSRNRFQSATSTNGPTQHVPEKTHKAHSPILDETASRITY
ncbi:kinase-like domain-containing protein [Tuber borchii]|uniref:non-specific serine/threonine protein kinase n=1 Tax=Tuber borchii TaxID=42251 RepID=A0A2T6ZE32_TUBBO|nr:kinase-like domain-containing protein [Tuber borchii]